MKKGIQSDYELTEILTDIYIGTKLFFFLLWYTVQELMSVIDIT